VTVDKLADIFRVGKTEAGQILKQYETTSHGQQNIKTGSYNNYKNNLSTGVHLIGNIVDGLVEGITSLGAGISKGSNKVITAKYGKEAGQLFA